jgi:hypothetical protein
LGCAPETGAAARGAGLTRGGSGFSGMGHL